MLPRISLKPCVSSRTTRRRKNLGVVLMSREDFDEAVQHFKEALRLEPDFAEAKNGLESLGRQGNLAEAARHFAEALRLKPDFADARRNLSLIRPRKRTQGMQRTDSTVTPPSERHSSSHAI